MVLCRPPVHRSERRANFRGPGNRPSSGQQFGSSEGDVGKIMVGAVRRSAPSLVGTPITSSSESLWGCHLGSRSLRAARPDYERPAFPAEGQANGAGTRLLTAQRGCLTAPGATNAQVVRVAPERSSDGSATRAQVHGQCFGVSGEPRKARAGANAAKGRGPKRSSQ